MSVFHGQTENFRTCGGDGSVHVWRGKGRRRVCTLVRTVHVEYHGCQIISSLPELVEKYEWGHCPFAEQQVLCVCPLWWMVHYPCLWAVGNVCSCVSGMLSFCMLFHAFPLLGYVIQLGFFRTHCGLCNLTATCSVEEVTFRTSRNF